MMITTTGNVLALISFQANGGLGGAATTGVAGTAGDNGVAALTLVS